MLKRWSVENFKSFRNKTELEFAPINVFAGANNSGKSTIIQSILMLKQTLQYAPINRPVALNGPLVKLGTFNDVKNNAGDSPYIGFSWSLEQDELDRRQGATHLGATTYPFYFWSSAAITSGEYEVRFEVTEDISAKTMASQAASREIAQLQPDLAYTALRAFLRPKADETRNTFINLQRSKQSERPEDGLPSNTLQGSRSAENVLAFNVVDIDEQTIAQLSRQKPDATLIGASVRHFLPFQIGVLYDKAKQKARIMAELICTDPYSSIYQRYSDDYINEIIPAEVLRIIEERLASSTLLPQPLFQIEEDNAVTLRMVLEVTRRRRIVVRPGASPVRPPPPTLSDLQPTIEAILLGEFQSQMEVDMGFPEEIVSAAEFSRFFFTSSVRYLGPLRDEPKPIYPLEALANPTEVGYRGEHTAAVLHLHRETFIRYIPSSFVLELSKEPRRKTTTLHNAVVDWLEYMGVIQEFATGDLGKIGHNLTVQTQGNPQFYDLTNVGVGVSQVLPIVVMALLAEQPCFLIFEQPELHLHPRVQARLADFFLSLGLSGKQCLVETHSEYLVERFRRRIAEADGDTLVDTVKIYFTERTGGATNCRPVDVSRFGAIPDYPSDFFDQSQDETEAILQAARAKRNEEKKTAQVRG